jgi:hypothetical protein
MMISPNLGSPLTCVSESNASSQDHSADSHLHNAGVPPSRDPPLLDPPAGISASDSFGNAGSRVVAERCRGRIAARGVPRDSVVSISCAAGRLSLANAHQGFPDMNDPTALIFSARLIATFTLSPTLQPTSHDRCRPPPFASLSHERPLRRLVGRTGVRSYRSTAALTVA